VGRLGGRGRAIEGSQTLRKRNKKVAVKSDTPGKAGGLMSRTASKAVALEFPQHGVGTDMQRSRGIAHPTGIETHVDDHVLDFRQASSVAIVEQDTARGTEGILAEVALSSSGRFPAFDNLVPLTVRAADGMESKDSALLLFSSRFPSSAPHTGQARFRASGVPTNHVCLTRQNSHDVSQDDTLCRVPMLVLVGPCLTSLLQAWFSWFSSGSCDGPG